MKNMLRLTRVQLGSAMDFIRLFGRGKNSKKSAGIMAVLIGAGILFGVISGIYSYVLGISFQSMGQLRLLPGMMMAFACILTLSLTIYKVKGTLFGTRDYDILMSLPVQTSSIVASRILLMYIINFFFVAILMLPNMIVYGYLARPEVLFYIRFLIGIFLLPLVPMIVAAILGTVIAAVASRFKHSNLINVVLFLVFFCLLMAFSFQTQSEEQLAAMGDTLVKQINGIYPLAGMFLEGVIDGNYTTFAVFAGISVAAFAVFCVVLGRLFKKLNTSITAVQTKSNYKMREQESSTPLHALISKELKRVFSSTLYLLNTCISMLLLMIASVALIILKPEQFEQLLGIPGIADTIGQILPYMFAVLAGMTYSAACSISLEGKNFWILRSAPVETRTILKSKIAANLILTLPMIAINTVLLGVFFKLRPLDFIMTFLIPALYAGLTSVGGLLLNLKFPVFDWTNEAVVIKQSVASMIACFGGILLGMLPILIQIFLHPPVAMLQFGTVAAVGLALLGLIKLLTTWGERRFESL